MCAEQIPASLGRMRYDEEAAGTQPQASATALYLWRPPNRAAVSVKVQSRWGNLYEAPAAIRSLAVNITGQAQVTADITTPEAGPAADRLPGRTIRLRVCNLPAPPYRGWCSVLISLGELADLVTARPDQRGGARGGIRPRPPPGDPAAERGGACDPDGQSADRCDRAPGDLLVSWRQRWAFP
jgi:hypothetical protein